MAKTEHCLGFLIWQTSNRWQRELTTALKPHTLTPSQFLLLAGIYTLSQHDTPVTQRALAKHVGADTMMTSKIIRYLEQEGLVLRAANHQDSRALSLVLSGKGQSLFKQCTPLVEQINKKLFNTLSTRTLTTELTQLLKT